MDIFRVQWPNTVTLDTALSTPSQKPSERSQQLLPRSSCCYYPLNKLATGAQTMGGGICVYIRDACATFKVNGQYFPKVELLM